MTGKSSTAVFLNPTWNQRGLVIISGKPILFPGRLYLFRPHDSLMQKAFRCARHGRRRVHGTPFDAFEGSGDQWGATRGTRSPVCAITDERYPAHGRLDVVANLQFLMMYPMISWTWSAPYVGDEARHGEQSTWPRGICISGP